MEGKKRIEFLDSMRGFTMIMVVAWHVLLMGFQWPEEQCYKASYIGVLCLLLMPLFFFVSGFVLYKAKREWSFAFLRDFVGQKFRILILSTSIFILLWTFVSGTPLIDKIMAVGKGGYWFTLTLFAYFLMYMIPMFLFHKAFPNSSRIQETLVVVIVALIVFGSMRVSLFNQIGIPKDVCNMIGVGKFWYFIYFSFGVIVRMYWEEVKCLLSNGIFMAIVVLLFSGCVLLFRDDIYITIISDYLIKVVGGFLGILMTLCFFYKNEKLFSSETKIGQSLSYIGRNTLDIYFLHYLILPRNLQLVGNYFSNNSNECVEFFVHVLIAIWVIALCLLVSRVIRMSQILHYLLFGAKSYK